jgi:glutaredoxin
MNITFPVEPSYIKQNRNTVKFIVKRPDEDISALAKAIVGDVLMLEGRKFTLTMRPLVHWQRTPGRSVAGSPAPRLTQAVCIGGWDDDPVIKKFVTGRYRVFSKPGCQYCEQAKALLTEKGLPFDEYVIDVGQVKDSRKSYVTLDYLKNLIPGVRTVPQIFKDDELIGGFEALKQSLSK